MAIPANFIIGGAFLLASGKIIMEGNYHIPTFVLFCSSIVITFLFSRSLKLSRLRVFLHESKHAIVVLMSGNKMKGFKVKEHEGKVDFQMYEDKVHYGPFIVLAPYCLPLLSVPALIFAILADGEDIVFSLTAAVILGAALGLDYETAFHDLHPQQTDFKQVVGGFFASALFIGSVMFISGSACLLWAVGGRQGFAEAAIVAVKVSMKIAERIPELMREWASN